MSKCPSKCMIQLQTLALIISIPIQFLLTKMHHHLHHGPKNLNHCTRYVPTRWHHLWRVGGATTRGPTPRSAFVSSTTWWIYQRLMHSTMKKVETETEAVAPPSINSMRIKVASKEIEIMEVVLAEQGTGIATPSMAHPLCWCPWLEPARTTDDRWRRRRSLRLFLLEKWLGVNKKLSPKSGSLWVWPSPSNLCIY